MKLQEFVSQALIEIIEGINEAKEKTKNSVCCINPEIHGDAKDISNLGVLKTRGGESATVIEFDVGVTITKGTKTGGNIGVVAGIFKLGSKGESKNEDQNITKLKFKVPVQLP